MKKSLMVLFTLISFSTYPGDSARVGNGGGVLFCEGREPLLLDFYEAVFNETYTFNKMSKLSAVKRNELFKQRVNLINSSLGQFIDHMSNFYNERNSFLSDVAFKIPDDFLNLYYEGICELKVVAVQREPILNFDKIFFINKTLWNQVDLFTQFGLEKHEIFYFITLSLGQLNSKTVREALSYVMSDQFDSTNEFEFESQFIQKILRVENNNKLIESKINEVCQKLEVYGHACPTF
jgi:hypothetical protein